MAEGLFVPFRNTKPQQAHFILPDHLWAKCFSGVPEIEDINSIIRTCKAWRNVLSQNNNTSWEIMTKLRIPGVQSSDTQPYGSWKNLYVHLLKSGYFYLPEMYTFVYFTRCRGEALFSKRYIIVQFANDDIIQFVVPTNVRVIEIVKIIAESIGLSYMASSYSLQKKEGDFVKPKWLAPEKLLEEQNVADYHILKFTQKYFFFSGPQTDLAHLSLSYHQAKLNVLSGQYICTRDEAVALAALSLVAKYGKKAESQKLNIMSLLPNKFFNNDPHIGMEVISAYQQISYITKIDAQINYLNIVKQFHTYGASFYPLKNTATMLAICPKKVMILKNATNHIVDEWGHADVQTIEKTKDLIRVNFGKYQRVVELSPNAEDIDEIYEVIFGYANFLRDAFSGKASKKLLAPVSYGSHINSEKTMTIQTNLSERVSALVKTVNSQLGYIPNPDWGLKMATGKWLDETEFVGGFDFDAIASAGLQYKPKIAPLILRLADGTMLMTFVNWTKKVSVVLESIGETLGISKTGLSLSLGV
eukprot:TRINITY_DN3015_c0_g1_i4.p1 TRINITY_DN3015_c0_g1~~TRINITY_DN3015_c0_g1_i4.p1  ORF type:complete len:530 (+),score=100.83 TRINITY_DN3015_c0_g1_i4:1390-2979(+)